MSNLQAEYEYAKRNGYTGTIQQYALQQYDAYCEICKRCGVEPVPYGDWLKVKES